MVTSCLKNVGDAIYGVYRTIANNTYKPGEVLEYGIRQGGMGLAIDDYTRQILPARSVQRLVEIQSKISSGAITVKRYQ
ncbi:MAG: hypothetical protein BWY85_01962 [Firmicutes bacterium ADurb.Bin506]|nr:MAG: hypothetical protein BWY85_01962 [Firmicutes bacterium ADurb.Bin506]